MVGCGNSDLSSEMYDDGYTNITNIDFSPVVIKEMQQKNKKRNKMKWEVMDVTNMQYENSSYSIILDKGALDAIDSEDDPKTLETVKKMFVEIERVCKDGGKYICISLLQDHVLSHILEFFARENTRWKIEVYQLTPDPSSSTFSPFGFVATRQTSNDNNDSNNNNNEEEKTIGEQRGAEMVVVDTTKIRLYDKDYIKFEKLGVESFRSRVNDMQWLNMRNMQYTTIHKGHYSQLQLFDDQTNAPKYHLFIVDSSPSFPVDKLCAIFIVPQGREHEWLFASEDGLFISHHFVLHRHHHHHQLLIILSSSSLLIIILIITKYRT